MSVIDDILTGIGSVFGGGNGGSLFDARGQTIGQSETLLPTWLSTLNQGGVQQAGALGPLLTNLPAIVGAAGGIASVIESGVDIFSTFFGDDESQGPVPLPTGMVDDGFPDMQDDAGYRRMFGRRSPQECLSDPRVVEVLRASQAGTITQAQARKALIQLGCAKKARKRKKCPKGMTRAKMCRPKPSNICGRPRRATRRRSKKSCGCAGACGCKRRSRKGGRRRLTPAQLRAGFGGKRRM